MIIISFSDILWSCVKYNLYNCKCGFGQEIRSGRGLGRRDQFRSYQFIDGFESYGFGRDDLGNECVVKEEKRFKIEFRYYLIFRGLEGKVLVSEI